jgi:hypothetical protein
MKDIAQIERSVNIIEKVSRLNCRLCFYHIHPYHFQLFIRIIHLNLYICNPVFYRYYAWMAELVDALVSGTSVRKDVQVRVLFQAQFI